MNLRVSRINADRDSLHSRFPQFGGDNFIEEKTARSHHHADSAIGPVLRDIEDIVTHERFTTTQDNDRPSDPGYLID
jgi:hypothetical protein